MREDDIDFQSNELGCELGEAFAASLRPAIFDREIAAVDPAEIAHSLHEGGGPFGSAPPHCPFRAIRWLPPSPAARAPPAATLPPRRLVRPAIPAVRW